MLVLPRLSIERAEWRECEVVDKIRQWIERENKNRSDGIHASHLLDIRYSYWELTEPPRIIPERQVFFFSVGKVLHALLLQAWNPEHNEFSTDSGTKTAEGIEFSPDLIRPDGAPIELKSNRAMREPDPERIQDEISSYIEQLVIYIILQRKREGELWILYLNMLDKTGRTYPTIRCYTITLSEAQYELVREEVLRSRDLLVRAIETRNPSGLPLCRSWRCSTTCSYWDTCRPPNRWPNTNKRKWSA